MDTTVIKKTSSTLNLPPQHILQLISCYLDNESFFAFKNSCMYIHKSLESLVVWGYQLKYFLPKYYMGGIQSRFAKRNPQLTDKEKLQELYLTLSTIRRSLIDMIHAKDPTLDRSMLGEFLMANFNDSTLKSELDTKIESSYQTFPYDAYILYRLLDGEESASVLLSNPAGLFGGYMYQSKIFEFQFTKFHKSRWPFMTDIGVHPFCFVPSSNDWPIFISIDTANVLGEGEGILGALIRHRLKPDSGETVLLILVWKRSVFEFMQSLGGLPCDDKTKIYSHIDTLYKPMSDSTTNGIRIRMSAIFSPFDVDAGVEQYAYVYQVRVSANGIKGSWKLKSAYLLSTDDEGEHTVPECKAVSSQPVIKEGCPDFVFESSCLISEPLGSLSGSILFTNIENNEDFKVQIPKIVLNISKGSAIVEHIPGAWTNHRIHDNY